MVQKLTHAAALAAIFETGDGALARTRTTGGATTRRPEVVMLHAGPGVPDYMVPVAAIRADLCRVHGCDQLPDVAT